MVLLEVVRAPRCAKDVPITIVNGFLGAGKTTIILNMLRKIAEDTDLVYLAAGEVDASAPTAAVRKAPYKVVWLKNEYGVNEVDSLLAKQSNVGAVKEILNGCLCCTLVRAAAACSVAALSRRFFSEFSQPLPLPTHCHVLPHGRCCIIAGGQAERRNRRDPDHDTLRPHTN